MRLLMFKADSGPMLGVLRRGSTDETAEGVELSEIPGRRTLIDSGDEGLAHARAALSSSRSKPRRLADRDLLAPLEDPRGNVIAIGRNYQTHAEETAFMDGREPAPPTVFTKAITSLTEPFADIAIDPGISDRIDLEVELSLAIGKRGASIKRAQAMDHVFGYTVLNEVTARDI